MGIASDIIKTTTTDWEARLLAAKDLEAAASRYEDYIAASKGIDTPDYRRARADVIRAKIAWADVILEVAPDAMVSRLIPGLVRKLTELERA